MKGVDVGVFRIRLQIPTDTPHLLKSKYIGNTLYFESLDLQAEYIVEMIY